MLFRSPKGLSIADDLDLIRCTGLIGLPEGLSVGGCLRVEDSPALAGLPEDLSVGGDLYLKGCTGLTGLLRGLADSERIRVNSVHSQGVDRLGPGLIVEARAPDGLIEAFRVKDAATFAVAVQWHPEWNVMSNPFSRALFAAFGSACRARALKKK